MWQADCGSLGHLWQMSRTLRETDWHHTAATTAHTTSESFTTSVSSLQDKRKLDWTIKYVRNKIIMEMEQIYHPHSMWTIFDNIYGNCMQKAPESLRYSNFGQIWGFHNTLKFLSLLNVAKLSQTNNKSFVWNSETLKMASSSYATSEASKQSKAAEFRLVSRELELYWANQNWLFQVTWPELNQSENRFDETGTATSVNA